MANIILQNKSYKYDALTDHNKEITPDRGYDALGTVTLSSKNRLYSTWPSLDTDIYKKVYFEFSSEEKSAQQIIEDIIAGNGTIKITRDTSIYNTEIINNTEIIYDSEWRFVYAFAPGSHIDEDAIYTAGYGYNEQTWWNANQSKTIKYLKFVSSSKNSPENTYVAYFALMLQNGTADNPSTDDIVELHFIGVVDYCGNDPYDSIYGPDSTEELKYADKVLTFFNNNNKLEISYLI